MTEDHLRKLTCPVKLEPLDTVSIKINNRHTMVRSFVLHCSNYIPLLLFGMVIRTLVREPVSVLLTEIEKSEELHIYQKIP